MFIETKAQRTVTPKPPYSIYRKNLGYYCTKCGSEKHLNVMRLCPCLDLEEDPKAVKRHINTFWAPLYADMEIPPPRPSASSSSSVR